MNKEAVVIWGRRFELSIQYDCYGDEDILPAQEEAYALFRSEADRILFSDQDIKRYCLEKNKEEIGKNIDNIFKYVMPVSIFVKREKEKHVVALLCDYKFDMEHGIAIVFENEKLNQIGIQDIIL